MLSSRAHQARTATPPKRCLPSQVEGDHLSSICLECLSVRISDDAALCLLETVPANSVDEAGPPIRRTSSHHEPAAASQAVTADHRNVVMAEPSMTPAVSLTANTGRASKNIAQNAQAMSQVKDAFSNATYCLDTPIDIAQVGAWAINPIDDLAYPSQISIPGRSVSSVPSPVP